MDAMNRNGHTVFDVHETLLDDFILFGRIEDLLSRFL
jgi:hypothetical protein